MFDLIARKIFYPHQWSREHALKPPVIDHMVNCEGVTEADVRDMRYLWDRDAVIVRTWNWRKFVITGIHQHEHSIKHEQGRK
jgi:hypothetical protein